MTSEILPPKVRKIAYSIYALLGVGIGATQVGFAAAEAGQPVWLTVSLAVFAFLGGAFGFVAGNNTSPEYPDSSEAMAYNVNPDIEYDPKHAALD